MADNKLILGIGVGTLVGLCILAKSRSAVINPLPKGSKILLVGDSLAVGLQTRLGVDAQSSGFPFAAEASEGTRADQWAPRIGATLRRERPRLVYVSLGTNDALLQKPQSQALFITSIVRQIRNAGAVPVWIFPPSMPSNFSAGLNAIRSLVRAQGIETIDSTLILLPRAQDAVHPYGTGYADWADWIWQTTKTRRIIAA